MKTDWTAGEKLLASEVNKIYSVPFCVLTAGENITGETLPVPIAINKYDKSVVDQSQLTRDSYTQIGGTVLNWVAQTFTTSANQNRLTAIAVKIYGYTLNRGGVVIGIYETAGGKPTGSALATKQIPYNQLGDSSYPEAIITLTSELTVSPSTMYAIVFGLYNMGSYDLEHARLGINSAEGYAGGTMYSSSDGGATWGGAITDDIYFKTIGYFKQSYDDGEVIMSDANANAVQDTNRLKFHGFAIENKNDGEDITIQTTGIVSGFTGLTIGTKYYVQDTVGTIGTVVGTTTILVGVAISATQLLIEKDITKL